MEPNVQALRDYIKSLPSDAEREEFAQKCGITFGYLKLVMYGVRKCSATLAIKIDKESNSLVSCDDLCPDADFNYLRYQFQNKPELNNYSIA